MQYRRFGKTDWQVSAIGFGAWAIGGAWGKVDDETSMKALHEAVDHGVNFIDTADVYGDGHSEQLVGRLRQERSEPLYVATKAGRRLAEQTVDGYNRKNLNAFVDRSLRNLKVDRIDLLQLHCPPTEVYYRPETFELLEEMVTQGKIRYYGVSVETVEQALKAIEHPNLASVQIIFNLFRQRPAELFLEQARRRNVAVIARVPLASGVLTGKFTRESYFASDDHRSFNRHGEAFDVGETFSGLPFETALDAEERIRPLVPEGMTMTQVALRWILMHEGVSCTIPGARNPQQARDNAVVADLPPISEKTMQELRQVYDELVRPHVHQRW